VVVFDFASGRFLGVVVQLERLNGQAIVLLPKSTQIPPDSARHLWRPASGG
jgi:hypothetical protein